MEGSLDTKFWKSSRIGWDTVPPQQPQQPQQPSKRAKFQPCLTYAPLKNLRELPQT